MLLYFLPHLINPSTLPCETENTEIVSFHVNQRRIQDLERGGSSLPFPSLPSIPLPSPSLQFPSPPPFLPVPPPFLFLSLPRPYPSPPLPLEVGPLGYG